ncbi:DUF58 domain-containing protein [Schaalia canis]|uniref:DUF58 domain-containing protein n=1 Tax=Schaalia canis TaxID=100469 RepID=A0A3P1SF39_9ACTO|nr:DUF58 domain-containing protein [Schaalia canis]RRC95540.1 DUF58 domain-containing protein [Schaalia canis]
MTRSSLARHRRDDLSFRARMRLKAQAQKDRLARAWSAAGQSFERIPVVGRLRPIGVAITRLGWAVWWSALLSLSIGLYLSWTEAIATGVLSLMIFLLGVLSSVGRGGQQVEVSLERQRVVAGEHALGEVTVINPTNRAFGTTRIDLRVGEAIASFTAPRLAAGEEHREAFAISTYRRGVVTVGPARCVRGDALGLLLHAKASSEVLDLFVHPRTVRISSSAVGFIRDVEGATTQDLSSTDVSFHALRDYAPGDDRRNIHWKTTARTNTLMVRQFEETRRAHLLIVFDLDEEAWEDDYEFELGVSAVASLVRVTMGDSKETSIVTQGGRLKTPTAVHALDALAGIERLSVAERLVSFTHRALTEVPQASVVIIVTGSRTSISDLHSALVKLPVSLLIAALRITPNTELESRTIAGVPVLGLPDLDALETAMRKVAG